MKNLFFSAIFTLMGVIAFGQSTCSCGTPPRDGCSASCGAGKSAVCEGYGGNCSCNCIVVNPQNPGTGTGDTGGGGMAFFTPMNNLKVNACPIISVDRIEKLTSIKFASLQGKDSEYLSLYNSFMDDIPSYASVKM